jgi:hypothetical protein
MNNSTESEFEMKQDIKFKLKDHFIFSGWIAGLVVAFALVWILCRPLLSAYLMASANQSLQGKMPRLSAPAQLATDKAMPLGMWYSLENSKDMVFIFTIIQEGILIPCGARISSDGKVAELFPVGRHAQAVWDAIPANVAGMYARRIENAKPEGGRK